MHILKHLPMEIFQSLAYVMPSRIFFFFLKALLYPEFNLKQKSGKKSEF